MKLAFVIITLTGPSSVAGLQIESVSPEPCAEYIDATLAELEEIGISADARCHYTFAPATSPRPKPRGTK